MKLLLLITLALTIFTGSQAFVLNDKPDDDRRLAQLKQELMEMETLIGNVGRGGFISFLQSDLVELVQYELLEVYNKIREHFDTLDSEISTKARQTYEALSGLPLGMAEKAVYVLQAVERKLRPKEEEFHQHLLSSAAQTLDRVGLDSETLRHHARRIGELYVKLNEKLNQDLQMWLPYARKLQSQWQGIKKSLEPITDPLPKQIKVGMEKLSQALQPYVAPTVKAFQEHKEEFWQWVRGPVFPPEH
ncbi:uncharacterized protein LOC128332442 [Hemicordylus capensis]|uniref:uncharacterized protein LOC128332442 n=1 Tax=Hemicordylus capensis TaxID=884348 RepID=UPI002302D739|nr:uncharacterized protein LOC128332442 [Hemicordylus capensis]